VCQHTCGLPCILHACISSAEVRAVVDSLREEFPGSSYNIITRNCNTFSNELARLLLDKPVPGYINRLANMGSFMSCLLPRSLTGAAPVEGEGAAAGGRAGAGGGASACLCVRPCNQRCYSRKGDCPTKPTVCVQSYHDGDVGSDFVASRRM
jgi:hypothetical protein